MDDAKKRTLANLLSAIDGLSKEHPAEVKKELWLAWLRVEPLPRYLTEPLTAAPEQQESEAWKALCTPAALSALIRVGVEAVREQQPAKTPPVGMEWVRSEWTSEVRCTYDPGTGDYTPTFRVLRGQRDPLETRRGGTRPRALGVMTPDGERAARAAYLEQTTSAEMLEEVSENLLRARDTLAVLGRTAIAAEVDAVRDEVIAYAKDEAKEQK